MFLLKWFYENFCINSSIKKHVHLNTRLIIRFLREISNILLNWYTLFQFSPNTFNFRWVEVVFHVRLSSSGTIFFNNIWNIFQLQEFLYGVIFSQLTGVSPLGVPPPLQKKAKKGQKFPTDWCLSSFLSHLTWKTV